MTELERTQEVLGYVLREIMRFDSAEGKRIKADAEAILNPVEYEEVEEIVGWVNVYPDQNGVGYVTSMYKQKEYADRAAAPDRISCQPIKVTVRREKRVPKERSVTVEAMIGGPGCKKNYLCSGDTGGITRDCPFTDHHETHGKTGTLTFTWQEEP